MPVTVRPTTAAATDRTSPSMNNWVSTRWRLAPSAVRTAIATAIPITETADSPGYFNSIRTPSFTSSHETFR